MVALQTASETGAGVRVSDPRKPAVVSVLVAALASGALVAAALPPLGWSVVAWVALVPLAVAACIRPRLAGLLGLLFGVSFWLISCSWMFQVPGFRAPQASLLALYLGTYSAAWAALLPHLRRWGAAWLVAAPVLWVGLDLLRAHAGLLAVSWNSLAWTQVGNLPLLQLSSLAGEGGVTLAVVAWNIALASWALGEGRRGVWSVAAVLFVVHVGGVLALRAAETGGRVLRVAAVQPSLLPGARGTPGGEEEARRRLEELTRLAVSQGAELVVWPESAIQGAGPFSTDLALAYDLASELGVTLLAGASEVAKVSSDETPSPDHQIFNSAFVLARDLDVEPAYRKVRLLPFAEVLPLAGRVSWPRWLVRGSFGISPGREVPPVALPGGPVVGIRICLESVFPSMSRIQVEEGAEILVHLVNDAWFGPSAGQQHVRASILRAVENRVPVVVATNTGPTLIVGPEGRVLARSEVLFEPALVVADVSLPRARTKASSTTTLAPWRASWIMRNSDLRRSPTAARRSALSRNASTASSLEVWSRTNRKFSARSWTCTPASSSSSSSSPARASARSTSRRRPK